jgi:hypothetical protein
VSKRYGADCVSKRNGAYRSREPYWAVRTSEPYWAVRTSEPYWADLTNQRRARYHVPGNSMRLLLVYNPNAAHRRAGKLLPEVTALFREKGIEVDLRLTEGPGHAVEIVRQASFGEYEGLVAAGGDGTLFEVVNGYYANSSSPRLPIGVVPTGTGNAFARDLELEAGRWPSRSSPCTGPAGSTLGGSLSIE